MITNRPNTLLSTLAPVFSNSDEILIASAYVSPAACNKLSLNTIGKSKPVSIIIGRAIEDGLTPATIYYFNLLDKLLSTAGGGVRLGSEPFHSKIYLSTTGKKKRFWIGSSNCTENGLYSWHEANIEIMDKSKIILADQIVKDLFINGRPVETAKIVKPNIRTNLGTAKSFSTSPDFPATEPDTFELSLLEASGKVPEKSGLNWWNAAGRPRDFDEAYIPIRKPALHEMRKVLGYVKCSDEIDAITHDGFTFKVRFSGPKIKGGIDPGNLESSGKKSILGNWILRKILKLSPGALVTRDILEKYGRTSLTFSKLVKPDGTPLLFIDFGK